LEQTEALDAEHFRVVTRHWLEAAADAAGPENVEDGAATDDQVSSLHLSRSFEGWLRIDGHLAPDDADLVEAALGAGVDQALRAAHDGDPSVAGRPVSALWAGALVDLAAQAMRHEPSDASVPDRYRVAVLVHNGQPTVPAEAACDAAAYRVALDAEGEVLDVGRQTNRWPVAIRRAITVRDRGCVFPHATGPRRGAISTTAPYGAKAAPHRSTTGPCSVDAITTSSTNTDGASPSRAANPPPEDPTAHPTSSNDGKPAHVPLELHWLVEEAGGRAAVDQ
jgi:hypothetical protein